MPYIKRYAGRRRTAQVVTYQSEGAQTMDYNGEEIYVSNPSARLRNEGKYAIAAFPTAAATPFIRLDPIETVVSTLFDGQRTCDEVAEISSVMAFDETTDRKEVAKDMLRRFLQKFRQPQGGVDTPLFLPLSDLSPEQRADIPYYRTTDYIIKPENYRPQDTQLSFPLSVLWLLTNDCQTNCQYCYMEKRPVAKKDLLPIERVKEIAKEASEGGVMAVYVSGGDVMCYPYLYDFLELMSEYEFEPTMLATKAYVSLKTARRLLEYDYVKGIQFSIDSTVPEIADFLVQSPGFYKRIMDSIRNCQKAGFEIIEVKSVITPYNLPTIPKLYRDLKEKGVTEIRLATYCKSGYHHQDRLFNHPDDYRWLDKQIDKLEAEFPSDKIYYQNGPPQVAPKTKEEVVSTWKNRSCCTAGRSNFTICADGKVVACEQMPERDGDYIGDLGSQSIMDVWHGKEMDAYLLHPLRERFKGTACFDCEEFDECQIAYGQCVRDCLIHYGTRWCPSPICPRAPEKYMRTM
jgi:MoaA/NifB/PqqE/SkfB family radical SAM enzyme